MTLNPWRRIKELEEELAFERQIKTRYKRDYYRLLFYGRPDKDQDAIPASAQEGERG